MKKIAAFWAMLCAMAVSVFAQNYTVQSVSGRVQKESGAARVDVNAGDILSADTVIITGIGASLILKEGDKTFTVAAAKNGTIAELVTSASAGLRISGNVAYSDTSAVNRTAGQVSTASARASDAAQDEDIAAE